MPYCCRRDLPHLQIQVRLRRRLVQMAAEFLRSSPLTSKQPQQAYAKMRGPALTYNQPCHCVRGVKHPRRWIYLVWAQC